MNFNANSSQRQPLGRKVKRVSDVNAMGPPLSSPTQPFNSFAQPPPGVMGAPGHQVQFPNTGEFSHQPPTYGDYNQVPQQQYTGPPPAYQPNMGAPGMAPMQPNINILAQPMVQNMAMQYGQQLADTGKQFMKSEIERYVPVSRLKYYFAVDTKYVLSKLKLLFFPFTHDDWSIKYEQDNPVQPRFEVNAPDLYIPTMAYVTYVLVAGLVLGMQKRFSPEQISIQASSALAWSIVEIAVYMATLYITNIRTMLSNVEELPKEQYYFSTVDYVVFGGMLLLSALTGVYHGCHGKKKLTTRKYLMGSNMQVFPVAMSLIASYVSGVTILGTPAEIYNFGTQYLIIVPAIWLMGIVVGFVYLPVFCKLEVNSSYEYLELRFNRKVRTVACLMFILDEIMFLPILIYVPALAFNQVTGVSIHVIGTIVSVICIFYTVIGGLKAVVWTDTLQIIIMFISVVAIVIIGTVAVGGPSEIWRISDEGGRLIFLNTNPSMYERHTVWSVLIGGVFYWTSFNAVNQTMVQRYMSLCSLKQARRSLALFTVGVSVFVTICCYTGLLVYTTYVTCDPLQSGLVKADDQLLPVFVMQTVGHLQGVPGLFIAGVFGAALSSLSVVLNSTAAVLLEDVVKGVLRLKPSETVSRWFVKGSALVLGMLALAFLYIVEHLGGVLSVATSLSAIAAGTTFGVFTLGMLVPWADSTGAVCGAIAGAVISGWISFGTQYATAASLIMPHKLPVSVEGCENPNLEFNSTLVYPDESNVFPLYRLSYHWIAPAGVCAVLLVGAIASIPGRHKQMRDVDPDQLSPVVAWMVKKRLKHSETDVSALDLKETRETAFSEL